MAEMLRRAEYSPEWARRRMETAKEVQKFLGIRQPCCFVGGRSGAFSEHVKISFKMMAVFLRSLQKRCSCQV